MSSTVCDLSSSWMVIVVLEGSLIAPTADDVSSIEKVSEPSAVVSLINGTSIHSKSSLAGNCKAPDVAA